ncbi:amidohydrolase family protein [Pelagibacterium limicola]|uniref:amidohydrolase family protein n=1 Tax=Pelagibacterium limicola TaxID=2791022 RepID=UPI001FE754CB|nr:amidohydrolase family protein [Pelagibacterium limicola]
MEPTEKPQQRQAMGRRSFLSGAAALGVGAGFAAPAIVTRAAAADPSAIALRDQNLKFIGAEETYSTEELMKLNAINDEHKQFLEEIGLADLGPGRLAAMDDAGLNVAILSAHTPGVQDLPREQGIDLAYRLNKMIATGPIATYPGRYQAFATLPLQDPEASADELERAVREDGFVGAMTNGFIGTKFLDHPDFEPLLERAEALNAPIYLHPGYPPKEVLDIYYRTSHNGEDTEFQDYLFSGSGYGWHQEVLTQSLRMILTGAFDRFPGLQVIIGHMGEGLPFFYKRFEEEFTMVTGRSLQKPIMQYFSDNFWYTTSAFPQDELLHLLLRYISVDRVMFATDYPFADMKQQTEWFRAVDLPREDKEKIAFRNAERLFGIKV